MKARSAPWLLACVVVFAGCPGGSAPAADAGDAAGDGWSFDVPPPEPPEPPVLTPCPEGWREVPPIEPDGVTTCDPWPDGGPVVMTPCPAGWREVADPDSGTVTCDPWPEGGAHECAPDEAHFPGEPGCTRIGTACPAGDWAEDIPTDREVFYVRAGVPPGGEGTQESPFGTIAEATAVARTDDVIAIGKGVFDEAERPVRLGAGVTLWGACVAETVVTCSTPSETAGTVTVVGRGAVVRNLHIADGRRWAVFADGASRAVDLQDVVISGAPGVALAIVTGAVVTGRTVVVRDTRGTELDGTSGRAVEASGGAQIEFTRAVFERNRDVALIVFDAGTVLGLTDVVVRDTLGQQRGGTGGAAVAAQGDAHVTVTRAVFERNRKVALAAFGTDTELHLTDVVVRDTHGEESDGESYGTFGRAVQAERGALVDVTQSLFERNREVALVASGTGTELVLTDVVVRNTQFQLSDRKFGGAVQAGVGAHVTVTRAVFERNLYIAIAAVSTGTELRLTDVVVRDTRGRDLDGSFGRGLNVQEGAHVENVTRALFEGNRDNALFASGTGTELVLTDVVVRDTQGQQSDRTGGRGLDAQYGAQVELTRGLFERNRDSALIVFGAGTELRLADVVVRDTLGQECVDDGCVAFGAGVAALGEAHADLTRFLISNNVRGLQLAYGLDAETGLRYEQGGTMDLHEGVVERNAICGVNLQTARIDLRDLMDHVIYRDNGMDLDSSEMPVPPPSAPATDL